METELDRYLDKLLSGQVWLVETETREIERWDEDQNNYVPSTRTTVTRKTQAPVPASVVTALMKQEDPELEDRTFTLEVVTVYPDQDDV